MKKLMMLLAFAGLTTVASAQEAEYPTLKHQIVTNNFWGNWFIDLGVDHLSSYSDSEHGLGLKKNPFWTGRRNWGADLSIGKWATPVFGMRIKGQANWATTVAYNCDASQLPTYNQYSISVQPMVSLVNLFAGYKPGRIYNGSLYAGFGFLHNTSMSKNMSMICDLGYLNTFNVTKRFHINLDIYVRAGEAGMDGFESDVKHTPRVFKSRDLQVGFSAGVGVNLGKVGWTNAPDVDAIMAMNQAQLDALNASLADAEAENARLKAQIANHKCKGEEIVKTVTEFATTNASVFFNINSTKVASKKDLVNVKELAELAKSKNAKVVVTGYADSKTGSAARNQTLSQGRAETVANELVKMGVSRDNIEIVAKGGVADLEPYNYNRRATVTLK